MTIRLAADGPQVIRSDTLGAAWLAVAGRILGHGVASRYDGLAVSPERIAPDGRATVSVTVTNTSKRAADEVVQLYLHDLVSSVTRPVQELKGFRRSTLRSRRRWQAPRTSSA